MIREALPRQFRAPATNCWPAARVLAISTENT
jgi:hypothetical protein